MIIINVSNRDLLSNGSRNILLLFHKMLCPTTLLENKIKMKQYFYWSDVVEYNPVNKQMWIKW